jgi:hypothetical protein
VQNVGDKVKVGAAEILHGDRTRVSKRPHHLREVCASAPARSGIASGPAHRTAGCRPFTLGEGEWGYSLRSSRYDMVPLATVRFRFRAPASALPLPLRLVEATSNAVFVQVLSVAEKVKSALSLSRAAQSASSLPLDLGWHRGCCSGAWQRAARCRCMV